MGSPVSGSTTSELTPAGVWGGGVVLCASERGLGFVLASGRSAGAVVFLTAPTLPALGDMLARKILHQVNICGALRRTQR
ncbi:MAG: hypothetical protein IH594_16360 [Bacteroidales bacterium]|nr:hypothetical protein [Bacteroidales bacterium]